jgi:hypothetical protein
VTAAIRSYEQIRKINDSRRGLNQIVHASTQLMALHGVQNFAAGVLAQIADLLGLEANGVLCVQECPDTGCHELMVMATAGSYRHLDNITLTVREDPRIHDALEAALAQRRNIYGPDYVTLYFAGKASRDFVAFLDTKRAPTEIDERLLEVFCANVAVGLDNVELVSHLHNARSTTSCPSCPTAPGWWKSSTPRWPARRAKTPPCRWSTSTTLPKPTTPSATSSAMRCWWRWPAACKSTSAAN